MQTFCNNVTYVFIGLKRRCILFTGTQSSDNIIVDTYLHAIDVIFHALMSFIRMVMYVIDVMIHIVVKYMVTYIIDVMVHTVVIYYFHVHNRRHGPHSRLML